jgi:hypothetical protein
VVIMDYMLIAAAVSRLKAVICHPPTLLIIIIIIMLHSYLSSVSCTVCARGNTSTKADKQNGVQTVVHCALCIVHCCAWVGEDRSWLVKIHLVPTCMAILSCIIWSHAMRDCAHAACQSMVRRPHDAPPGDLVTLCWLRTPLVGSQAIYHASCLCPAASPG